MISIKPLFEWLRRSTQLRLANVTAAQGWRAFRRGTRAVNAWLVLYQLAPSVIEDGRAFRYASNSAIALSLALAGSWILDSEFDTPMLNALLHVTGIALLLSLYVLRRQRTARYRLAEAIYFVGLAYALSFLPWSLYFYNPSDEFALAQAFCGLLLMLFIYPLRPALFCTLTGLVAAISGAIFAWFVGRSFHAPTTGLVLLLNLPVWLIMRAYADRTTKDKVFAVKVTTDTIAHEMRTPMMSIEASCEALRRTFNRFLTKTLSPDQHSNTYTQTSVRTMYAAITRIENDSQRMRQNLNLLLQNASSPKSVPTDTKVIESIAQVIREMISSYPFYSAEDLENIRIDVKDDFPVWLSPGMFENILTNLLKNSLHSLQKAGKGIIVIEVKKDDNSNFNLLTFKDTGGGMSKATLAHVFTPFYTTRQNGQGLGLPFCRTALALFGADINAESVEKEYAVFTIRFPNVEHRIKHASNIPSDDDHPG